MGIYTPQVAFEVSGTQVAGWSVGEYTASVTLQCAWVDRNVIAQDLLDNRRPWPHVSFARQPTVVSVGITAFEAGLSTPLLSDSIDYSNARLQVNYSTSVEDLISESIEPVVEYLPLDHARFRWASADGDALKPEESPSRPFWSLNLVRTIYSIAPPLPTAWLTLVGKVNEAEYTSALTGLVFPIGTVMYKAPSITRTIKTDGTNGYNATFKLGVQPQTWNKYWRSRDEDYVEIFDVEGAQAWKQFPEADFSSVLFL